MGKPRSKVKSFDISKYLIVEAWRKVEANAGAPGVDGVSVKEFRADLRDNLYKVWNRMSAGSYMPGAVRAVEIPKDHGAGVCVLGVPNVADRVAQTAVAIVLEEKLEPILSLRQLWLSTGAVRSGCCGGHAAALLGTGLGCRFGRPGLFDSVDHDLMMKAVAHHTDCRWVLLYIERWLNAPIMMGDGTLGAREKGTPQGSPISPVLANLFMHYAFDRWMEREYLCRSNAWSCLVRQRFRIRG